MNDSAVMVQGCFVKIHLIASEKLAREDLSLRWTIRRCSSRFDLLRYDLPHLEYLQRHVRRWWSFRSWFMLCSPTGRCKEGHLRSEGDSTN